MKFPKINLLISQVVVIIKNNINLVTILNRQLKTSYTINIPFVNQIITPNIIFNFASTKFNDENIIMAI